MDDITYTFNQTNRERKGMANGAKKRVSGAKSKKCSLPSDNLTPAQLRKLSGPVREYNITKPMSWEQFKEMPKDLQEAYLRYLHQRFGASQKAISEVLFGKTRTTLNQHVKAYGLNFSTSRGSQDKPGVREALEAWKLSGGEDDYEPDATPDGLLSELSEPVEPEITDEPETTVEPDEPVSSDEPDVTDKPATRSPITSATLRMAGEAEDILDALARFLGKGKVMVDVNITFIKEEN